MTGDVDLYDRFVSYLRAFAVGSQHAQTAVTICAALGLDSGEGSRRALRACAHQASRCGVLICSGQTGYYVPGSPADVRATTTRLRSEAAELKERADRMEQIALIHFERPALFALMEAN